jgi:oligopeptidase A
MNDSASNPLLAYEELPRFSRITAADVGPAFAVLLPRYTEGLAALEHALEGRTTPPSWDDVVPPLRDLTEPMGFAWKLVHHLLAVRNTEPLRTAHAAIQPQVVAAFMAADQSLPIYRALVQLRDTPATWHGLDEAQRRIVTATIRGAEHAGVSLEGEPRTRFQAIALELADLSTRFDNHLLDASKAFAIVLTDPAEVDGLPPSARAAAAHSAARASGASPAADAATRGPWRITLDIPSYLPFMEHGRRRDLRERLYRAYIARASSGSSDNQPLVERILALRLEQARLLGLSTFAELSLASKMAPDVAAVEALLGELRGAALPKAQAELDDLTAFARSQSGDAGLVLSLWDIPFWAERLRESRYAYSDEELRPYFALPSVLDGLFSLAQRLFGISVRAAGTGVDVWDPSVRYFLIADEQGRDIASFFLDPYTRPADKRGGAWMDSAVGRQRRADGSVRLPVAYLVCNQTAPVGDMPSLMTFHEVETLFHEFGHGLQHMLTRVDQYEAAGIANVEWDAVELPSQFMENWCFDRQTMLGSATRPGLARHWQSGEPLPVATFERILSARTFRAASATARQVNLASLDLELHHRYRADGSSSALAVQRRVAAVNAVLPPVPEDRMLCGFSHIFSGGYAAGYYSYKWAEVLAADAFAAFEEAGLDRADAVAATGRRFRDTVLALGGSRHPLAVFSAFRGRPPSSAALLKQSGLR